ncbi:hypothetical protein BS78_07G087100 [Paspalum vaginatum]|nr:hypothetical protein BS78_07G087100 [Paspalum vaginatum]
MAPKWSGLNHGEQVNCDRESPVKSKVQVCENITTVAREDEPVTVVPRVTCFNCSYEGHYANQCPKKTQLGELEQYDVTCSNFQANRCRKKTSGALELCDITCFNCNDKGHYARNCSKEKPPRKLVTYGDNHGYQSKGGSGMAPHVSSFSHGVQDQCEQIPTSENANSEAVTDVELTRVLRLRVTCFNCHDDGHYANMCPKERVPRKLGRGTIPCLNCNGKHYTIRCRKRKKPGELKQLRK